RDWSSDVCSSDLNMPWYVYNPPVQTTNPNPPSTNPVDPRTSRRDSGRTTRADTVRTSRPSRAGNVKSQPPFVKVGGGAIRPRRGGYDSDGAAPVRPRPIFIPSRPAAKPANGQRP